VSDIPGVVFLVLGFILLVHLVAALGGGVISPGGKLITKGYLKKVERLRQEAREEVEHEKPSVDIALPTNLTDREVALVQKFVTELRREQGASKMEAVHTEPLPGSSVRKSSAPRHNLRSFQNWKDGTSGSSGQVREHRTVQ